MEKTEGRLRGDVLRRVLVFLGAFAVSLLVLYPIGQRQLGDLYQLPGRHENDSFWYDYLARQIAEGRGFTIENTKASLVTPHKQRNSDGIYDRLLLGLERRARNGRVGETVFFPPGYPAMLAVVYRLNGWRPDLGRWLSLTMAAAAVSLAVVFAEQRWGVPTATLAFATTLTDERLHRYCYRILSEAPATFLLSLFLVCACREAGARYRIPIAGVVFILLGLTRPIFLLWLPPLLVVLRWHRPGGRQLWTLRQLALLAGLVLLGLLPWSIRNCAVAGGFQPLPTCGVAGLPGALCDESVEEWGNVDLRRVRISGVQIGLQLKDPSLSLGQREHEIARQRLLLGREWALENWTQLPELFAKRCLTHLGLSPKSIHYHGAPWILVGLVFGAWRGACGSGERLLGHLLLLSTLVVGVSYSCYGRYLVPLLPMVHVGAAVGFLELFRVVKRKLVPPVERAG